MAGRGGTGEVGTHGKTSEPSLESQVFFGSHQPTVDPAASEIAGALLEGLTEPALLISRGHVVAHNSAMSVLLGPQATVPSSARDFFSRYLCTQSAIALDLLSRCQSAPRAGELERVQLRLPHGHRLEAALTYAPLRIRADSCLLLRLHERSGDLRGHPEVLRRESLALTGQLASGVAHAINNPLAYVTTNIAYCRERLDYIESLLSGKTDVQLDSPRLIRGLLLPLSEALGEAALGTTRVEHLARNLKTLAEADSDASRARIGDAVDSALLLCEGAFRHKAKVRTDTTTNAHARGSLARLSQVVANVVFSLAATFQDNRPSRNRMGIRTYRQRGDIIVEFLSNGPGLTPSTLSSVQTIGLEAWTAEDGPVLWLLSAKRLLHPLGGSLEFEARQASGDASATVVARLRLRAAETPAERRPVKRAPRPFTRKPRIMVVDNEPLIVRAITRFLGHDYDVDAAGDGKEALQIVLSGPPPDLVLCDLLMPEMSGMELYRTITIDFPDLAERFAFLTGGAPTEETADFLRGVDRPTLSKPVDPASLRAAVRDLLEL